MNVVAISYAVIITFLTGIILTNYHKIENLITNTLTNTNIFWIEYITERIILGTIFLCIFIIIYKLIKDKANITHTSFNGNIKTILKPKIHEQ